MTDVIKHCGPEDEGFFLIKPGFKHRRLPIIDLEAGGQPMFSDNKQKRKKRKEL
jgi:asparagine synthetase B (glutamine-hydrolysing)